MGWSGPMTHRQFLTWMEWLAEQWNVPNRTDHYLMRVALRCHQAAARGTSEQVTEEKQVVRFIRPGRDGEESSATVGGLDVKPLTKETRTAMAKSAWHSRMGPPVSSTLPKER